MELRNIYLKQGREKSVHLFHPWIFSGAVDKTDSGIERGEMVRVVDDIGHFLAYGYFNPASQIQVRLLEWDEDNEVKEEWWFDKIARAVNNRKALKNNVETDAYRLIFSECDLLPGLIADRYGEIIVIQVLTAGIEANKSTVVDALIQTLKPSAIYERSEVETRLKEGLKLFKGIIYGKIGEGPVEVKENGLRFLVDIKNGQKTGWYLDQRENRKIAAEHAPGKALLDCFCYSGGFSLNALKAGAKSVTMVDASGEFLGAAEKNVNLNGFGNKPLEYIQGDAFEILRKFYSRKKKFDIVILDPPKFASSRRHLQQALAGYKDINLSALRIIKPGGILVTFSCSGAVSLESFRMAVFWASVDANRQVQILQTLSQGTDHPRLLSFPEGEYLKGLVCRVY